MKWLEIKNQIESQGVTDESEIAWIDIPSAIPIIRVIPVAHEKNHSEIIEFEIVG